MTKKGKRKRNKSSPLPQNPTKKQLIKDYFTSDSNMAMSQNTLSMDTLAACAEAERDIEALKDKSLEDIIKEMARDIKDIKLQQTLDKKDLLDLKREVSSLKHENLLKDEKIKVLEIELTNLKSHSMRNNLLFRNVESGGLNENVMVKVRQIIAQMGLQNSQSIRIERAHRLGRPGSNTPIVVKFAFYEDRMSVWQRRTSLKGTGYFINEHFPSNIEDKRREMYPLLPFLKRKYGKEKVFLRKELLVCERKEYSLETLPELLDSINEDPGALTNEQAYVFLGKYSPLSNFFPCKIEVNGNVYCSSEQAYQHAKACYAGDKNSAEAIKAEVNPVKIKHMGDNITTEQWFNSGSAEKAMKGILTAKFSQIEQAKEALLATGNKCIGEANSSKNSLFWSTGIGKGSSNALNVSLWNGKNKLGEILEAIRKTLTK